MNITGTLMKAFGKKINTKFGEKDLTDVYIESNGQEYKAAYWNVLDKGLLGSTVQVDLEERGEYKGTKQYQVKGSLTVVGDSTANNNIPMASTIATTASAPEPAKDREEYREKAEEAVINNLKSAQLVAKKLKLKDVPTADLIVLGDMCGRTLTAIALGESKGRRY